MTRQQYLAELTARLTHNVWLGPLHGSITLDELDEAADVARQLFTEQYEWQVNGPQSAAEARGDA